MKTKNLIMLSTLGLGVISHLYGQASVGQKFPDTLGFTQAPRSAPLQNLSEFDYNDIEGQVVLVVYHASW